MAAQESSPSGSRTKTILPIVLIVIVISCLCLAAAGIGGYFLFKDQIEDALSKSNPEPFTLNTAEDGTISGQYSYQTDTGSRQVSFTADPRGVVQFNDGQGQTPPLKVALQNEESAVLEWDGHTLDGKGALTDQEQAAFEDLLESDLGRALTEIPLLTACQDQAQVAPRQMASLLVPLQMQFKYQYSRRSDRAQELLEGFACQSAEDGGPLSLHSNLILFSTSAPVPVVPGYFPFDEEGAVEGEFSLDGSPKTACMLAGQESKPQNNPVELPLKEPTYPFDEKGPCNALCRGACGADCDEDNCSHRREVWCEKDEEGKNTGYIYGVMIFDCGLHRGCINHDNCYDKCNRTYGCDTWSAAHCRHAVTSIPTVQEGFCDQTAIYEEGPIDPALWMYGFGDMPDRKTFVYRDKEYGYYYNPGGCEVGVEGEPQPQATEDEEKPADTGEKQEQEKEKPLDVCDFMPEGGTIKKLNEWSCFGTYSDEPGVRTVQLGYSAAWGSDNTCKNLAESEFTIVMKELPLGDCGFQVKDGYQGTPGVPGYEGWGRQFGLDGFLVSVKTKQPYPAEATWIDFMVHQIELDLKEYLKE